MVSLQISARLTPLLSSCLYLNVILVRLSLVAVFKSVTPYLSHTPSLSFRLLYFSSCYCWSVFNILYISFFLSDLLSVFPHWSVSSLRFFLSPLFTAESPGFGTVPGTHWALSAWMNASCSSCPSVKPSAVPSCLSTTFPFQTEWKYKAGVLTWGA